MTVTTNLSLTEDLKKKDKKDISPMVLKLTALEMIDLHYLKKDWPRVYTDGSQADEANTAGAGVTASSSRSMLVLVEINRTLMEK
jgi:hypothetical protein